MVVAVARQVYPEDPIRLADPIIVETQLPRPPTRIMYPVIPLDASRDKPPEQEREIPVQEQGWTMSGIPIFPAQRQTDPARLIEAGGGE